MGIVRCEFEIEGVTNLSFSKKMQIPKEENETDAAYEERCWKDRLHTDPEGNVFIPPMALKKAVESAAKQVSESVPGKKNATYTKHFKAGILCPDELFLGIKADDVPGEWLFVPSNGQPGGGKRVDKCFPFVPPPWKTQGTLLVLDPILQETSSKEGSKRGLDKVHQYLEYAGQFIGLLRFRPANGGFYGRYKVNSFRVVN